AKAEGETAAPKVPQDTSIPKPEDIEKVKFGSQPEPGYDEAAAKALQAAYVQLSKTELGKQLEQSVKSYVLSAEGIPLDAVVAGGVLTFVATNDPKLPSVPEIPIGEGVKIKIDYSGRASDLPPLVRDLLRGHSGEVPQPGKGETKIGLGVTVTNEAIVEMAKAVEQFFAEAATWIAKGVVKAGTVIGKAVSSIKRELIGALGGAALGGLIGGLAGGGIGAVIGAGVGALAGLAAGFASHLLENRKK